MAHSKIQNASKSSQFDWKGYWELCKPKVVALMLLTAWVGMFLASEPLTIPYQALLFGSLGIALISASAAVLNHVIEHQIDTRMRRTCQRPVATGRVSIPHALIFSLILGISSLIILTIWVNPLCAWLSLLSLIGYALIYTRFLKRATPQNIVIGGLAGATPPLLGWTAVSGQIDPHSWLLVLIIFAWTPPHFWALALYRKEDYAQSGLPMLPVTHGESITRLFIVLYTVLLWLVTLMPYLTHMSGLFYLWIAIVSGAGFMAQSLRLYLKPDPKYALKTFVFSIVYLMFLFTGLLIDHCLKGIAV